MKKIESLSNPYVKYLFSLKDNKKNILKEKIFLIEGNHLIQEANSKNIIKELFITDEKMFADIDVKKTLVPKKIISKLSNKKTNIGAIAVCELLEENFGLEKMHKIIVLDSINDPGNFGTIIRVAKAFNYDAVVCLKTSPFKYSSKVISSSQGAIFKIPVLEKEIDEIKDFYPYYFVLDKNSTSLTKFDFRTKKNKYALVFGNEANGIRKEIISEYKGEKLFIKINDEVESLNVASAVSIASFFLK